MSSLTSGASSGPLIRKGTTCAVWAVPVACDSSAVTTFCDRRISPSTSMRQPGRSTLPLARPVPTLDTRRMSSDRATPRSILKVPVISASPLPRFRPPSASPNRLSPATRFKAPASAVPVASA